MDLIDRYLQAVKFWLPKAQQQDILQELSVDIQSQVEDKEAELGHKLNEVEVADLLKKLSDNSVSIAEAANQARSIQSKYGNPSVPGGMGAPELSSAPVRLRRRSTGGTPRQGRRARRPRSRRRAGRRRQRARSRASTR